MAHTVSENQQIASDPGHSAWVAASAGTGKTKVLTDRVLRLLLGGTLPGRILCLTYTNAAAAEMANRLHARLQTWLVATDKELETQLDQLLGRRPSDAERLLARRLFATVLDAPEGVRILTIHSLCQSLLQRFAIEAGVSPYFRVIDERETKQLIEEAKQRLLAANDAESGGAVADSLGYLARKISILTFDDLIGKMLASRSKLQRLFNAPGGLAEAQARAKLALNITEERCDGNQYDIASTDHCAMVCQAIEALGKGGETDVKHGKAFSKWLASNRFDLFEYLCCFHTTELQPYSKFGTKKLQTASPGVYAWMQEEKERCAELMVGYLRREAAENTRHALVIAEAILSLYADAKRSRGLLDFEDLIQAARDLLYQPDIAPWVLYKLDGGLDHLLVDEAQDTSPVQWQLVKALAEDFFSGRTASEVARTLFVVGDEKQSIYSFQGAEPAEFASMRRYFSQKIRDAQAGFESVNLNLSYRSTGAVLRCVDATFAAAEHRRGFVSDDVTVEHSPHRNNAPGRVELWPLMQPIPPEGREAWEVPVVKPVIKSPEQRLAERIAGTIDGWLKSKRIIKAKGRPVTAGDILVLVRNRGNFTHFLMAALRRRRIPTAGMDRLLLADQIAIMDMLACAQFLLLPDDDLNLACLLKSPLFGMDEETLLSVCYGREGSVWQALQRRGEPQSIAIVDRLRRWLSVVDFQTPYALFAQIIEAEAGRKAFEGRLGEEVNDALDEFLSLCLLHDQQHAPSLQGFLHWFQQSETEIKRDMDTHADEVRIMTVHGAKGLQAPIVFLPDTTGKPKAGERLFWGDSHLLVSLASERDPEAVTEMKQLRAERDMEEHRRLLYVAMTRAEDELYIAGWQPRERQFMTWHGMVSNAMQQIGTEIATPDGQGWMVEDDFPAVAEENEKAIAVDGLLPVPEWVWRDPPGEPLPPKRLAPSRPAGEIPGASSPMDAGVYQRGRLVHRLLEILPAIAIDRREMTAALLIRREGEGLSEHERAQLSRDVQAIIDHPDYAPLFASGSLAEVPITAMIEQDGQPRVLSGRIDRLVVTDDRVLILDYKTGRIPDIVPPFYVRQVQSYAKAVALLYPDKRIEAAILWTSAPALVPVILTDAP